MKFSTKTRYGIRAMLEIARQGPDEGIFQKDIAESQEISVKYLDHIIHALKVAGLITSVRGKKSGYILKRPASDITMLDIHNAFEPGICLVDCLGNEEQCDRSGHCAARGFWEQLNNQVRQYFERVTLEDLVNEQILLDDAAL